MAWTSGGPLLSVGDLLEDLGHDFSEVAKSPTLDSLAMISMPIMSSSNVDDSKSQNEIEGPPLHDLFERTYNELMVALGQSGNAWLELTQKLCAALTAADKLEGMIHMDLGLLLEKIKTLQSILDRGSIAVRILQNAASDRQC